MLHTAVPTDLKKAEVKVTDKPSLLIDDFSHGWQDWYLLEAGNPYHWEFSTRKLADPKWHGQPGQRLALEVQAEKPNELVVVLTENFFRSYRGKSQEFVAVVKLNGGNNTQSVSLEPKDFKTSDGEALSSWNNIDLLSLRAYYEKDGKLLSSKSWAGGQPKFRKLCWQGS
jgi:hypothetical protein